MRIRILTLFLISFSRFSGAIGDYYVIDKVGFNRETKKVEMVYGTVGDEQRTTVRDSGPVLLCVLRRLLAQKQQLQGSLSKQDLTLMFQAAYFLPEDKRESIRTPLRSYLRGETDVYKMLGGISRGVGTGIQDHVLKHETVSEALRESTKELISQRARMLKRLEVLLDGKTEAELRQEERAVLQVWRNEIGRVEKEIRDAKPVKEIEVREEPGKKFKMCDDDEYSRGRSQISNKNVDELLAQVGNALSFLVPVGQASLVRKNH